MEFDDTSAIQATIDAACSPNFSHVYYSARPVLFFPPGLWQIYQPQLPSRTRPSLFHVRWRLRAPDYDTGRQFSELAPGSCIFVNPGRAAKSCSAITFALPANAIMKINRQSTAQSSGRDIHVANPTCSRTFVLAYAPPECLIIRPLKLTDSLWLWYKGGRLQTLSSDVPVAMFTAETYPLFRTTPETVAGLVFMSDLITAGGGFKYIQRVPPNGPVPGNFVFRNITMEEGPDVFEITQEFTGAGPGGYPPDF